MPASSSPIDRAVGHLADLAEEAADDPPGLLAVLGRVADPRHRREVRHRLAVILGWRCARCWPGHARSPRSPNGRGRRYGNPGQAGRDGGAVPPKSTFRRTLHRLDAEVFDDQAGQWAQRRTAPGPGSRRVIAVDGKTLRGSRHGGDDGRHLLATFGHAHGVVLGQAEVGAKANEIPRRRNSSSWHSRRAPTPTGPQRFRGVSRSRASRTRCRSRASAGRTSRSRATTPDPVGG
jgi:hypothetical protein